MIPEQNIDANFVDLKTTRENAGFTLKDMYERTRISVANLEAIENGDFHLLPVPIYTRNFIKTYTDALGVDCKPVLQRYENYLQAVQIKENAQKKEKDQGEPLMAFMTRHKAYLWVFCIIIVFMIVSLFVSLHKKPQPDISAAPETTTEAAMPALNVQPDNKPVIEIPPKQESATATKDEEKIQPPVKTQESKTTMKPDAKLSGATSKPVTTPSENPQSDARKVQALVDSEEASVISIQATEETWVRITADNQEPVEALLQPGEKISQKGARFQMDIGNAAGVRIKLNGRTFENLGKSGQVIHLRLP